MKNNILDIQNLSKSYDGKKYALGDCNLTLQKGNICAVVGESGSGKSTLLRLIAGLERPNSGSIVIDGAVATNDTIILSPQKRNVGMVFQDYALFPHLTVAKNIGYGLKHNKTKRVEALLQLIQMQEYANTYPNELSGGQQQRVALARTLSMDPELLLLDEPFSNLDATLKSQLRKEIRQIIKNLGSSMLFITHDLMDAIDIADEIVFLEEGKILASSTMQDFSKSIQNKTVAKVIADLKTNAKRLLEYL